MSATLLGPYAALGWRFTVESSRAPLVLELERVLAPLASDGPARGEYVVQPLDDSVLELRCGSEVICRSDDEALVFSRLLWHVNLSAVEATPDLVLLHAAAAEHEGRAVVLCAPMEAGKTTLVAGLVRSGLRYLTDETVALRPADGRLIGYPKSLSVDRGSWPVLDDLRPPRVADTEHLGAVQWNVPADSIRPDAISRTAQPAVVVLPQYVAGAETVLTEISPGTALLGLLQQTFRLERSRPRDMQVLADLVSRADTYRLQVGELAPAVELVRRALAA